MYIYIKVFSGSRSFKGSHMPQFKELNVQSFKEDKVSAVHSVRSSVFVVFNEACV